MKCRYCNKEVKNQKGLNTHYRFCKKRYKYLKKEIENGNLFPEGD